MGTQLPHENGHSTLAYFSAYFALARSLILATADLLFGLRTAVNTLFLWPPCVADADIIFLSCFYLSIFLFSSPNLSGCRLDVYHTSTSWCGLSANLECRSEMYCTRLAGNTARKKSPSRHHRTTLSGCIFATNAYRQSEKKLLKSNTSSTCSHNMVNFGPLTAEMRWRVWGTLTNFNGFRVLAALLHGTLVVGVSQTLRR